MAKITSLSCDLETYSSVELSKCGVYKYVQADDFEILLFGYSVDGGPVTVIDLAQDEKMPEEILAALADGSVTKWAWNASFERICLSVWLRKRHPQYFRGYGEPGDAADGYLDPASWRCTMTWAAYLGLPLSLDAAGNALHLAEQKMGEGKNLIRFFSVPRKPTKYNPATRNLPADAPDRWQTFKEYNKRDVEVEMQIQQRIAKFPMPEFVWDEYHLSEQINDRGIGIDMELVRQAILFDAKSQDQLTTTMRRLTGLENPNSVQQMKQWLAENDMEMESLGKKEVAQVLQTAPEPLRTVLSLRQQLAKSSVKKYAAMQNAVCKDGRARGMFQFYGANRTGRFCLTGDHEVLTRDGWMRLDEWCGGSIACWNSATEAVSFQKAESVSFPYDGPMYTYVDGRIDQCSTPDHKMRVQKRYGSEWQDMTIEEMACCRPSIPVTGYRYHRGCANPAWIRVLIMTQADGHYTDDGAVRFHFRKQRKIERCKHLLRKAEIPFSTRVNKDSSVITISARAVPLWLREFRSKTFGFWLLDENPDIFFDELPNWDGYFPAPNSIQYSTCNKQNADIVQALAHMSGRAAIMRIKKHSGINANWKDAYVLDIWLTPKNSHEIRVKPKMCAFSGMVYCAVTQTGYFLVRRNGKVWVTGNSGKIIQLQNLPQNHMADLEQARGLVKSGDYETVSLLYEDVPDTLSQLVRTAFVPKEGFKFIVADFSAIEARVIAWLAGERWRMEAFANGEDIYCASASRMFHVPVEKNGVNTHLRQKGKIAELALGYGGSVGALKAMGALDMGIAEDELQPLVDSWRSANQSIVRLWWDVDRAVKECVKDRIPTKTHGLRFSYKSGMMFISLPSGRQLAYAKPQMGMNRFGGEAVTYMGIGVTKKWERLESYGPKFVENIVQGISRDILCHAMKTLREYRIVAHVHDELIIECEQDVCVDTICEMMGKTPDWISGLPLRADGYECGFYQKK